MPPYTTLWRLNAAPPLLSSAATHTSFSAHMCDSFYFLLRSFPTTIAFGFLAARQRLLLRALMAPAHSPSGRALDGPPAVSHHSPSGRVRALEGPSAVSHASPLLYLHAPL